MADNTMNDWSGVISEMGKQSRGKLNLARKAIAEADAECPLNETAIRLLDIISNGQDLRSRSQTFGITPEQAEGYKNALIEYQKFLNSISFVEPKE